MILKGLFSGCWWSHGETIWEGQAFRCLRCDTVIPVLPQAVIKGPAHDPPLVRGVPKTKTFTDVVEPFTMKKKRA